MKVVLKQDAETSDDAVAPSKVPSCWSSASSMEDASACSWLRSDCRDLYLTQILPSSATRVGKRSRMIRFSINHAWSVKNRFPQAQFLEFGVHQAKDVCRVSHFVRLLERTSNNRKTRTAAAPPTIIHGFDSFRGLPEDWDNGKRNENGTLLYRAGTFDLGGVVPNLNQVREALKLPQFHRDQENVQLHPGWFHDTVPAFFDNHSSPIAFVHADADLYGSTMTFLEEMCRRQLVVVGTVITFDEFANFENWQHGEYMAWTEIVERYHLKFRYICYHAPTSETLGHYGYQSVSVVVTDVPW